MMLMLVAPTDVAPTDTASSWTDRCSSCWQLQLSLTQLPLRVCMLSAAAAPWYSLLQMMRTIKSLAE